MKYDEYKSYADSLTTENAPIIVGQLLDAIKDDLVEKESLEARVQELDAKVKDLQDTNIKLFLNQTSDEPGEDDVDEEAKLIETVENAIVDMLKED